MISIRNLLLHTICLLCGTMLIGQNYQIEYSVDKENILIGDHINFALKITPVSKTHKIKVSDTWQENSQIELLEKKRIERRKEGENFSLNQTFVITTYDTGRVEIPSMEVIISYQNKSDTIYTEEVPLYIQGLPINGSISDIKDIYRPEIPWILYIILLIIGIIILYLLYRYITKRKTVEKEEIIEEEEINIPDPRGVAKELLDQLKKEDLVVRGREKEFQSRLTFIIRQFLQSHYDFPALEMTTREIIKSLKNTDFPSGHISRISDFLSMADLVKFAKAKPVEEFHEEMLKYAYEILHIVPKSLVSNQIDQKTEDSI